MKVKSHTLAMALGMGIGLTLSTQSMAEVIADWGTVVTPITSETTFSFAQYDINKNFTDQYAFSLEGGAGASYTVTFSFDPCQNGCGNPDIAYGIYDATGGLIGSTDGAVTLSAGNYAFQVKGTGMGSGNTVDYTGSVTFSVAGNAVVSPAPEPASLLLSSLGLGLVVLMVYRRRSGEQTMRLVG